MAKKFSHVLTLMIQIGEDTGESRAALILLFMCAVARKFQCSYALRRLFDYIFA